MPGRSRNQIIAMRIAEHNPEKLYARNAGMLKMKKPSLHDFAVTPTAGLPKRTRKPNLFKSALYGSGSSSNRLF